MLSPPICVRVRTGACRCICLQLEGRAMFSCKRSARGAKKGLNGRVPFAFVILGADKERRRGVLRA